MKTKEELFVAKSLVYFIDFFLREGWVQNSIQNKNGITR